jgi:hypothetical protein
VKHNALARLTHEDALRNEPKLRAKVDSLPIQHQSIVGEMDEAQIAQRIGFYKAMCEEIWNPEKLGFENSL